MGLVDINANFGRRGLTKDGWCLFIKNLDATLKRLEKQGGEAKEVCEETKNKFNTYTQVQEKTMEMGCASMQKLKTSLSKDTTRDIAIIALAIGIGHVFFKGLVHGASWLSALIKHGG